MDQFTDDLRRELRRAALREEERLARPRLPRLELLPRLAMAACLLLALFVGVNAMRAGGEREVATDPALLPAGSYVASLFPPGRPDQAVRYELRIEPGRYELRAGEELERAGALRVESDVATFGSDGSCGTRDSGEGSYRVQRDGDRVSFRVIDDPCEGRASVLTSPQWLLGGGGGGG